MSHTMSITLPDAIYDALVKEAASSGHQQQPGKGKSIIARHAIRAYLTKRGHGAHILSMDDKTYQNHKKTPLRVLPDAGKPSMDEILEASMKRMTTK